MQNFHQYVWNNMFEQISVNGWTEHNIFQSMAGFKIILWFKVGWWITPNNNDNWEHKYAWWKLDDPYE